MINFVIGIFAVLILIVGILAFVVASKNKKIERQEEEKKELEKKAESEKANADLQKTVSDNYKKEMEQNEELKNIAHSDNLDGFNANIQRMQNLSKK